MASFIKVTMVTAALAITATVSVEFVPTDFNPYEHWPPGELNCWHGYRWFNPLLQKKTYYVGVHAPTGLETAMREFNLTFETYLDRTVGDRFIPPINFKMKPTTDPLRDWVDLKEEVDFMYSDTGLFSCVGVEIDGQPLGTTIAHLTARGKSFNLDVYGGSMVVRADNKAISSIADIKGKIIGAQSISDFAGAQVQFYVMFQNGLDYIMDPKQVIFTDNQEEIVRGVLDGRWDVGFVRTGQIERTLDENGSYLDEELFKILEPKIYVLENGDIFPFLHSTPVFPEWPLYAKNDVDRTVSEEVQIAFINFEYHKIVGDRIHSCKDEICDPQGIGISEYTNCTYDMWKICETAPPVFFDKTARCDTTREIAELAYQAGTAGRHNGFRPARSHFALRTMQQTAGFLRQNENGDWQCSRASTLYEGIICPPGHYKVKQSIFEEQCDNAGLPCPEGMKCYCQPCIKSFEVDVLQWEGEQVAGYVSENGTDSWLQAGCDKMSLCGTVKQTKSVTFRVYDHVEREGAIVTAIMHVGRASFELPVRQVKGLNYVYEFSFSDNKLGVGILEVYVNDKQIPESPFRVQVIPRDCDFDFPGQGKSPTETGNCECGSGKIEIRGDCMDTSIFASIMAAIVLFITLQASYLYLSYRRAKSDEVWQVNLEELHFSQPAEVVGQGSFGVVLLAEYRGTKVAIKRVLPLKTKSNTGGSKGAGVVDVNRGSTEGSHEVATVDIEAPADTDSTDSHARHGKNSLSRPRTFDSKNYGSRSASRASGISTDDELDFLGGLSFGGGPKNMWEKSFPWLFRGNGNKYNASILGTASGTNGGSSTSKTVVARLCPWFDENTRRQQEFVVEMRLLSRLRHPCITTVMGAVMARGYEPMMVMEYMDNGSLYDILRNETLYTGGEIIMQVVRDVAQGLRFLHASKPPILHGDLKAKNILIDSRFRAKVADFGLATKTKNGLSGTPFWMAPEYLRGKSEYNTTCDIYSFGIIMYEIYSRKTPYEGGHPRKILRKVCDPRINLRPQVPAVCPPKMVEIMTKCWSQDPFYHPQAKDLDMLFMDMSCQEAEPVVDEGEVRARAEKISGDMMYKVFPRKVADKLRSGQKVEPETHENVTIFFSDIVGFTDISRMLPAVKVCAMLDRLYLAFDNLSEKHKVHKMETIGDAWMGVTNLENDQDDTHAKQIAEFAVDAVKTASKIMIDDADPQKGFVRIRVGFHSGSVVSNVIGSLNPRYGLFGDTVNTASRMESNSVSQKIQCSDTSAALLKEQAPDMPLKKRGKISIKGKGNMTTYWVGQELLNFDANGSLSNHVEFAAEPMEALEAVENGELVENGENPSTTA